MPIWNAKPFRNILISLFILLKQCYHRTIRMWYSFHRVQNIQQVQFYTERNAARDAVNWTIKRKEIADFGEGGITAMKIWEYLRS